MDSLPTRDLLIEIQSALGESQNNAVKLWTSDAEILQPKTRLTGEMANRSLEEMRKPLAILTRSPTPSMAQQVGQFLFEFLPGSIARVIEDEYQIAKQNQQILRLKIVSRMPSAIDMPWELLYIPSQRQFLALHENTSIIRYVPTPVSSPPLTLESFPRILFVMTNPKDERLMNADRELDAIKGNLDNTDLFTTEVLWEPTLEAFTKKLVELQPHIVHYIGHSGIGRGEGNLILHDNSGRTYWLAPNELSSILPPTVQLLCASTCFTVENYQIQAFNRLGQTWGRFDLPNMVVNQLPLSEEGVRVFWQIFYSTLRKSGELNTAVSRARLQVAQSILSSPVDWASFVIHLRSESDKLFSEPPTRITTRQTPEDAELISLKTEELKTLEIQINSLTGILNDLKAQVSDFDKPPTGIQKAIEGTENRHSALLGKLNNLKNSLDSSGEYHSNAGI
jgi:hypothetical protein